MVIYMAKAMLKVFDCLYESLVVVLTGNEATL